MGFPFHKLALWAMIALPLSIYLILKLSKHRSSHAPNPRAAWLLLVPAFSFVLSSLAMRVAVHHFDDPSPPYLALLIAWVYGAIWFVADWARRSLSARDACIVVLVPTFLVTAYVLAAFAGIANLSGGKGMPHFAAAFGAWTPLAIGLFIAQVMLKPKAVAPTPTP